MSTTGGGEITKEALDQLLKDLDCNQADLARRLGIQEATVSRWFAIGTPQGRYPSRHHRQILQRLILSTRLRKTRNGRYSSDEVRRMVAELVEAVTLTGDDETPDYQRGWLDGYRDGLRFILENAMLASFAEAATPPLERAPSRPPKPKEEAS